MQFNKNSDLYDFLIRRRDEIQSKIEDTKERIVEEDYRLEDLEYDLKLVKDQLVDVYALLDK